MKMFCCFIFAVLFFAVNSCAMSDSPCRDGESVFSGNYPAECLKYITMEPSAGIDRGAALKLTPDQWHNPTLGFHCGGKSRKDLTSFTALEFYFRSPDSDPGSPTIQLKTWNQSSNVVRIRDYIAGGNIDDTYRLVSIPLSVFRTPAWDLGNVENLVWNLDAKRRTYFVDRIELKETSAPSLIIEGEYAPFPESDTVLKLNFTKRWQEDTVRDIKNYSVSSPTDPAYVNPLHPVEVGLHYRVHGFSPSKVPYVRFSSFIRLPFPLKDGNRYILRVSGIKDSFCNSMLSTEVTLQYDDRKIVNPNIKVNQEGYLPEGRKVGYVGGYFGDLGGGAWTVGNRGAIFSWKQGQGWKKNESPADSNLRSISGLREDDLYCVGDGGEILHFNGDTWKKHESPTASDLRSIYFGPQGIGWAVGRNGVILRNTGAKWENVPGITTETLNGVWAGSRDSAWTVGDNGVILKWSGKNWINDERVTRTNLNAIGSGGDSDQLWAVGDNGTVLLRSHGKWKPYTATPTGKAALRCLSVDPGGGVWIGGDNGLLWHKPASVSEFKVIEISSDKSIYGLTRQNARRLWAAGSKGLLLRHTAEGVEWCPEKNIEPDDFAGIFSLPYGVMRLPKPATQVSLLEAGTGKTALKVPLKLETYNWNLSGEDVYSFDFSSIRTSGLYRAFIPGIGVSAPILISDSALNKAAYATAHAFYYQRCGTPLTGPYAEREFVRPLCHEHNPIGRKIDADFHESLPKTPLYSGEKPGEMIDTQGGWHDAGDYGKYMPTAAAALWYLFTGYEIDGSKFLDGAWNIPESGNGVPDLLDETRWELDWIVKIQAEDGGVYHKQTSQTWFNAMPQDEKSPRFLFEKTTHDTALAAAVLANGARLWRPYDSRLAETYLVRAKKAWDFLEGHPAAVPDGGFRNPKGNVTGEYRDKEDIDNRLWAATELYRATGQQAYKDYFESWWRKNKNHPWGWNTWQDFYRCAYWAYLNSGWPNPDLAINREIKRGLLEKANKVIELTNNNPYRNGARLNVPDWIGWGAFTQSSEYSFLLLQAWSVTRDMKYRDMALLNLDTQLGANPLSMSFITGLGHRSPKDPLHLPSTYDGIDKPIPGLPVFGPTAHLPNNQPYYVASQSDLNSFPQSRDTLDPYPILRRYIDANQLVPMSEFTIVELAACAATINILAQKPDFRGN